MAAMMYFQDFDETYAPSAVWGPPNFDATTRYWWPELINAYAKNTGVFVCPSDEPGGWAQNSPNAQVRLCSYTMNAIGQGGFFWPSPKSLTQSGQSIGSRGGTGFTGSNFGVAQVQDPAGTIYLVESKGGNGLQPELWQDSHTDYVGSNSVRVAKRHQEGFNIVWADGHAKWVKFGSTKGWQWTVQAD
jgi:prepilin-type processing-associated H-X9-DG protein